MLLGEDFDLSRINTQLCALGSPGSLGIQQQLLCLADVVLGPLQDGVHVGEAANPLLDLVSQVSDLERRGRDGELQHAIGHGFNAVWVGSLLWG